MRSDLGPEAHSSPAALERGHAAALATKPRISLLAVPLLTLLVTLGGCGYLGAGSPGANVTPTVASAPSVTSATPAAADSAAIRPAPAGEFARAHR